ncbi:MAG: hypothetical protein WBP12_03440 [Candidatus Saccharimonas sp.]
MKLNEDTRSYRFLVLYTVGFICASAFCTYLQAGVLATVFGFTGIVLAYSAWHARKKILAGTGRWIRRDAPSSEYLCDLATAATWSGPILHESIEREPGYLTAAEDTQWAYFSSQLSHAMNGDPI